MSQSNVTRTFIILRVTYDGEIMVTDVDGRIRFMGWIKALRLAWSALRQGIDVRIE